MQGNRQFATVIGKGTHIKGDMSFETDAAILGGFEGRLTAGGLIQIGSDAICRGEVKASDVHVDGRVEGQVRGGRRVDLGSTSHVTGDVVSAVLVVAAGATLEGHFRIGPDEVARPTTASAQSAAASPVGLNGKH